MPNSRFVFIPVLFFCLSSFAQEKTRLSVWAGPRYSFHTSLRDQIIMGPEGPFGYKEFNTITFSGGVNLRFFTDHFLSFSIGAQVEDKGYRRKNVTSPGNGTFTNYVHQSVLYGGIPLLFTAGGKKKKDHYFFAECGLVPEFCLMNKDKGFSKAGLSALFSAGYSFKRWRHSFYAKMTYEQGLTNLYQTLSGSNFNTRVNSPSLVLGVNF